MQLVWSVIKVVNKSIYLRISDMVVIECTAVAGSRPTIFSWEPALWPLNSQERVLWLWSRKKHCNFRLLTISSDFWKQNLFSMSRVIEWDIERVWKCESARVWESESVRVWEWLLSIEMKTKVVQHVKSDSMRDWKSVSVRKSERVRVSNIGKR